MAAYWIALNVRFVLAHLLSEKISNYRKASTYPNLSAVSLPENQDLPMPLIYDRIFPYQNSFLFPTGVLMDHDQLIKTILAAFFVEFLELFYPELAQEIKVDSTQFFDKETFTDLPLGEQEILDVLAKVETVSGKPPEIFVHIEGKSGYLTNFPERMFNYYTALRLRYHLPIFPREFDALVQAGPFHLQRR